jgi:hypothetical protein
MVDKITTYKPDRYTARMLTDLSDGIHPTFTFLKERNKRVKDMSEDEQADEIVRRLSQQPVQGITWRITTQPLINLKSVYLTDEQSETIAKRIADQVDKELIEELKNGKRTY